jgi:hypothetical protein
VPDTRKPLESGLWPGAEPGETGFKLLHIGDVISGTNQTIIKMYTHVKKNTLYQIQALNKLRKSQQKLEMRKRAT